MIELHGIGLLADGQSASSVGRSEFFLSVSQSRRAAASAIFRFSSSSSLFFFPLPSRSAAKRIFRGRMEREERTINAFRFLPVKSHGRDRQSGHGDTKTVTLSHEREMAKLADCTSVRMIS